MTRRSSRPPDHPAPPADATLPLYLRQPVDRFTPRAAAYARARPDYPAPAIDALLAGLGPPQAIRCADLGAGTGIASRQLADRGLIVDAVEPNPAMRAAATDHPRVVWHATRAEQTGLPSARFDLVTCFQSFHWFQPESAFAEIARILRPGGRLALVWNDRDQQWGPSADYSRSVRAAAGEDPAADRPDPWPGLLRSAAFVRPRRVEFPHAQRLDLSALVDRALSASYVPRDGPGHDRLIADLHALHARHADRFGCVELRYRCRVCLAERC